MMNPVLTHPDIAALVDPISPASPQRGLGK
jgi:hypothetical protein